MGKVVRTETRRRGFLGKTVKFVFVVFNLLMVLWLVSYWMSIGEQMQSLSSDAERAGANIGATFGTGMLMFFWVAGVFILGMLTFFTRGKKVVTEEILED